MLLIAHTATGAIIGQKIGNPVLVSTLALASHFLLDWLPHWSYDIPKKLDPREFVKILPDVLPTILIYFTFLFAYPEQLLLITLGVTFGILPDFLVLTNYIPGLRTLFKRINSWHAKIQVHDEKITGLLSQVIYISLLIIILLAI